MPFLAIKNYNLQIFPTLAFLKKIICSLFPLERLKQSIYIITWLTCNVIKTKFIHITEKNEWGLILLTIYWVPDKINLTDFYELGFGSSILLVRK